MSSDSTVRQVAQRLVEFYQPERIYLFGSAARGDNGPDSDLDVCVVLRDDAPERLFGDRSIHERFWGLHSAVDVVRFASSDFDAQAEHVKASLPATILRVGKLLYDARRVAV